MKVPRISHKWGGLRTFAPDHEPVIGADPQDARFTWLAGQGGNGVMACAAAARLAAAPDGTRSMDLLDRQRAELISASDRLEGWAQSWREIQQIESRYRN